MDFLKHDMLNKNQIKPSITALATTSAMLLAPVLPSKLARILLTVLILMASLSAIFLEAKPCFAKATISSSRFVRFNRFSVCLSEKTVPSERHNSAYAAPACANSSIFSM